MRTALALPAAFGLALASVPGARAGSGLGGTLGGHGLSISVDGLTRQNGVLVLTYTLFNYSSDPVVLSAVANEGIRRAPQVSVLDPDTGAIGDRLGTDEDCRCSALPIALQPVSAITAAVELADPGGTSLDVVFGSFQPVPAVSVTGTSGAAAGSSGVRQLLARTQELQSRSRQDAARFSGSRIDLETDVLFAFNSAKLSSKAGSSLRIAAAKLKAQPKRRLAVYGHTDGVGSAAYNLTLSLQRAQAVRQALAPLLGAGWSFEVKGLGETKPIAPEKTDSGADNPDGRALNRRVELTLLP